MIECPRAQEGMGASLACGVMASPDASGWIVALADMPWIRPATIQSVAAALGYSSQTAFAAAFRNLTGETPSDWRRRVR